MSVARLIDREHRIHAPREQVWRALADLGRYREWNPFLPNVVGRVAPGARLLVQMRPPGGNPMRFHARIARVEPEARLVWVGRLASERLFRGEFSFALERVGRNGTAVVQQARFDGVLAGLVPGGLYRRQEEGLRQMADALDAHVRARSAAASTCVTRTD